MRGLDTHTHTHTVTLAAHARRGLMTTDSHVLSFPVLPVAVAVCVVWEVGGACEVA